MIVYRLEHGTYKDYRTGCGGGPYSYSPYCGTWLEDDDEFEEEQEALFVDSTGDTHLGPYRDPILKGIQERVEICGLDSLESFIAWFGEERVNYWVERFGFIVAKYDVPEGCYRVGMNGQVLFEFRKSTLVKEVVPSD